MAHGDEIAASNEDMSFAELDLALDKLGGAQHDKQGLVIDLELRPLMGAVGVLDGQLMEIEPALDLRQHLFVRLIQPDPDEGALVRLELVELIDVEIGDPAAVLQPGSCSPALGFSHASRHLNLFSGGGKCGKRPPADAIASGSQAALYREQLKRRRIAVRNDEVFAIRWIYRRLRDF
jgi:hypothetical protein